MIVVAFDFETALIRPGVMAPEAACLTWQTRGISGPAHDDAGILHAHNPQTPRLLEAWLKDPGVLLVGANTPFDAGVIVANWPHLTDLVWRAYEANRITDVQTREKLLDIAGGKYQGYHTPEGAWIKPRYSLGELGRKYGIPLDKPVSLKHPYTGKIVDDWMHARLRFQELIPYPVEEWDERALKLGFTGPPPTQYAKEDAVATLHTYLLQEKHADPFLKLQYEYARRDWCLHLCSAWGVRTDPARVKELIRHAEEERERVGDCLREFGLVRADGTRDVKKARSRMLSVCREANRAVPLTKTGLEKRKEGKLPEDQLAEQYASLDEDACDASGDPILEAYADFSRFGSVISKDGTALSKGTTYPIHTRFDLAATGRTTSSKPNMQNFGREVGPRECFVARPGTVIAQADYEALELRTLAQVCVSLFGMSQLADALNSGKDPHLQMGADILGITYDEAKSVRKAWSHDKESPAYKCIDDARQLGKVANFGFPGGLGAEKLVLWGRKTYGVNITVERAKELKKQWLATWQEMGLYFEYISELCDNEEGLANITVPISGFMRGGASHCAACNTNFQSLGASAAGRGLWYVQRACYHDRSSILFGSRAVNFVHDEILVEVPDNALAHDRALELEKLMCKGANEFLPDVPATAPPMLMRYWSKSAQQLLDSAGRIIPWSGQAA